MSNSIESTITSSAAYKTALSIGMEACCASKFAGPQFYALTGGTTRVSDPAYAEYRDCPSRRFCIKSTIEVPEGLKGPAPSVLPLRVELPRYIPLVNPYDERTYAHHHLRDVFSAIAVQPWPLSRNKRLLREVMSKGLHDYLDFDGTILLSSVMPDQDIMEHDVNWFIKLVKDIHPDIVTTWDVPTYSDHPPKSSMGWVLSGLEAAKKMALTLDIPLIGLVSGADLTQVKLSSECLRQLGFKNQALACQELLRGKKLLYLKECAAEVKSNSTSLTLLSCSYPTMFQEFQVADHFVGMSWFYRSYRFQRTSDDASPDAGVMTRARARELATECLIQTVDASEDTIVTLEEVLGLG